METVKKIVLWILYFNGVIHLKDSYYMIRKIIETARTIYRQRTCKHLVYIKDVYSMDPGSRPTAHCQRCWLSVRQSQVNCRSETKAEYIARVTKGGMPANLAEQLYEGEEE